MLIAFRDHLLRHQTLEAAYIDLVRARHWQDATAVRQSARARDLAQRARRRGRRRACCAPPRCFSARSASTLHEGSLVAADEETMSGSTPSPVSPLVSMLGLPAEAEIDIMNDDNAETYWERSDRFDMALDLTAGRAGLAALAEAMRALDRASARP